jgi:hypothetical protein
MSKLSTYDRGSTATKCLEEAWTQLRALIPSLPRAVIVLLDAQRRRSRRGHFAPSIWKTSGDGSNSHEIGVSPRLFGDPEELLATLLHEAAHPVSHERRVPDCTGAYYHLTEFRDTCKRLGLGCRFRNSRYGWNLTSWPENGNIPSRYAPIIEHLKASMPRGAGELQGGKPRGKPLPKPGRVRLQCRCPRSCYASLSVAARGGISCTICGAEFVLAGAPGAGGGSY